jgi:hypothetical protein
LASRLLSLFPFCLFLLAACFTSASCPVPLTP